MIISPNVKRKFFERLLLSRDPVKRQSPYTWLGKRAYALADIADGIYNLFTPKNCWGKLSMDFVLWEAERGIERRIPNE